MATEIIEPGTRPVAKNLHDSTPFKEIKGISFDNFKDEAEGIASKPTVPAERSEAEIKTGSTPTNESSNKSLSDTSTGDDSATKLETEPVKPDPKGDGKESVELGNVAAPNKETTKTSEAAKEPDVTTEKEFPDAGGRDFSGLEENEVPLFKRMSNSAFAYLKPKLLEAKSKAVALKNLETEVANLRVGKVTLPDNYYQHPQAYLLTPEAGEAAKVIDTFTSYQNHWENQLLAVKQGKDWVDLVKGADGSIVYSAPQPATPQAELAITKWMNHAARQIGEAQGKMTSLQQTHTQRYQESEGIIKGASKEYFGYLDDAKHPARATYEQVLAKFPSAYKNHPLADLAARATTACLQLQEANKLLKAGAGASATVASQIKEQATKAGPSGAAINNGGGTKVKSSSVSMGDYKKEME